MSFGELTREQRIAVLRSCIDRQLAARQKLLRDLRDLDETMARTLTQYMDLVAPASAAGSDEGSGT